MGSQELLLHVLTFIIVGMAVVVGYGIFQERHKKHNAEALVFDVVRLASEAQVWYVRPTETGGGGGSWASLSLRALGYQPNAEGLYGNLNGHFDITATPDSVLITGLNPEQGTRVVASVRGVTPKDLAVYLYDMVYDE